MNPQEAARALVRRYLDALWERYARYSLTPAADAALGVSGRLTEDPPYEDAGWVNPGAVVVTHDPDKIRAMTDAGWVNLGKVGDIKGFVRE